MERTKWNRPLTPKTTTPAFGSVKTVDTRTMVSTGSVSVTAHILTRRRLVSRIHYTSYNETPMKGNAMTNESFATWRSELHAIQLEIDALDESFWERVCDGPELPDDVFKEEEAKHLI